MNKDGSCDISIVDSVIKLLSEKKILLLINLQSFLEPHEKLNKKIQNNKIIFNPEFLTERNAVDDYENQNRIIIGGPRPATNMVKTIFSKSISSVK